MLAAFSFFIRDGSMTAFTASVTAIYILIFLVMPNCILCEKNYFLILKYYLLKHVQHAEKIENNKCLKYIINDEFPCLSFSCDHQCRYFRSHLQ